MSAAGRSQGARSPWRPAACRGGSMSAVLPPLAEPAAARAAKPLSPNQRAWARFKRNRHRLRVAVGLHRHAGRRDARRAGQQRPPDRRAHQRPVVRADVQQPAGNGGRRRLQDADRLEGPAHRRPARQAGELGAAHLQSAFGDVDRLLHQARRPGAAERRQLARHRRLRPRHAGAAAVRLSRQHLVRDRADGDGHRASAS